MSHRPVLDLLDLPDTPPIAGPGVVTCPTCGRSPVARPVRWCDGVPYEVVTCHGCQTETVIGRASVTA